MPSIFIWKSDIPNTSKKYIRFYSGSNWFLEDKDYTSNSYMYLQQIVIPEYDDSVITFHAKKMSTDWVGAELLEVNQIPYQLIKSDHYGTLEHIGSWLRFISSHELPIDKTEFEKIKTWISIPFQPSQPSHPPQKTSFQPKKHISPVKQHTRSSNAIIDPQMVQQNFQRFLNQYNVHTITNQLNQNKQTIQHSIPLVSHF